MTERYERPVNQVLGPNQRQDVLVQAWTPTASSTTLPTRLSSDLCWMMAAGQPGDVLW